MLSKMGFDLNQFLPLFAQVQTPLDHTVYNENCGVFVPASDQFNNLLYPITTNAAISTSLNPALCNLFGTVNVTPPITYPQDIPYPSYTLGQMIGKAQTTADSEIVLAKNIAAKTSFPYLVCRSNIMTPTAMQYIGGPNGQQILPAIGYLMTNYATNDYFYVNRSDLIFTVNRPYVLTEITTSIHLPNGKLANFLDKNSAVIYRIDFAQDRLTPEEQIKIEQQDANAFATIGQRTRP